MKRALKNELEQLVIEEGIEQSVMTQIEERLKGLDRRFDRSTPEHPKEAPKKEPPRFVPSTYLLAESFAYLRRQPEESLHLATGVVLGTATTVDTLVPVPLANATVISAEADPAGLSRVLADLDRVGHYLTGVFHIHPGEGIGATQPSSVDRAYMERLRGRSLVFGIWSRDAYCRVMTIPEDTPIELYGNAVVETRKENHAIVYKLEHTRESLLGYYAGSAERMAVGRTLVRPARTRSGV